jgi:hypothetical protein
MLILMLMIVDLVVIVVAMGHSKYSLQYLRLRWHGWMCLIIDGGTSTGIIIVTFLNSPLHSSQCILSTCTTVVSDAAQSNFPSLLHILNFTGNKQKRMNHQRSVRLIE